MNQIKVAVSIQVLNAFIGGVLGVALPLMMAERNIDIVTIGFIFAAMPMIFQLGRMVFATVSDFWGRKLFFVSNGFLSVVSNIIYWLAHTPLEFLFGKVMEGTKGASLWAVNRAFLLEKTESKWKILVYLRTVTYLSSAFGSLLAGFLVVWLLYEGTLLLCVLAGTSVIPLSLLIVGERKKPLNMAKALLFLDPRKKEKAFKKFLVLFFVMGLSLGFLGGYVFPLYLNSNGFDTESIGVFLGLQVSLAALFSYLFAAKLELRKLLLLSGLSYTIVLTLIGFSSSILAGILIILYGAVDGLLSVGQEGIMSIITNKTSYGTDIGLLMMGLHSGRTLSLAASGLIISSLGFPALFILSASTLIFFYTASYLIVEE